MSGWLEKSFDDSSWPNVNIPSAGQCPPSAMITIIDENGAQLMSYEAVIWSTGYFRKTFNLGTIPSSGSVRIIVDDDGDLYINGNLVISDHDGHIAGIDSMDISPYLVAGENVIALKVIDSASGCQHA